MKPLANQIKEAERYLDNAKQILSEKAGKEGYFYSDPKYVRMAGNTAWNGILIALDATLDLRIKLKKNARPDVHDYQKALLSKDKNMYPFFTSAYETLHKSMGYDGVLKYKVVQSGMEDAKMLVSWASKHYKPENI